MDLKFSEPGPESWELKRFLYICWKIPKEKIIKNCKVDIKFQNTDKKCKNGLITRLIMPLKGHL